MAFPSFDFCRGLLKTGTKLPPVHPGRILLEDMKDEEISINGLAQAIRVPANRISLIVNGKRGFPCFTRTEPHRAFPFRLDGVTLSELLCGNLD